MIVASMSSWGSSLREVNLKRRMCEISAGRGEFSTEDCFYLQKAAWTDVKLFVIQFVAFITIEVWGRG